MMSTYVRVSLRSKHFRLVSEQRKSEERDFRFWPSEKWNESQKMKEGGGFLPLLPTLSPLTRAALKHTTRPACNKAASQCCLSLKRFVVVLAGFATFFTSNYVSKCFNGFDRRRKIHLYVDERKTGQEHWEDSLWRRANARNVSFSICLWCLIVWISPWSWQNFLFATLQTRRGLEPKCIPQLFLGSLPVRHRSIVPSNSPRSLCGS